MGDIRDACRFGSYVFVITAGAFLSIFGVVAGLDWIYTWIDTHGILDLSNWARAAIGLVLVSLAIGTWAGIDAYRGKA